MLHAFSTVPSSSGDFCFPLLTETFEGVSRNFLFGDSRGPASALLLEDSREDGGWGWEPRIMTSPLRCSSILRTQQNGSALGCARTRTLRLLDAEFCSITFNKVKVYKIGRLAAQHRCLGVTTLLEFAECDRLGPYVVQKPRKGSCW
jgi:hypothetical protein